ncbi:MAG: ATP-binding cassette domain-containing protein [Blastochloris sp.]|nr:ATP-binding cassette domain-containing protein [Blastochloris sp.]
MDEFSPPTLLDMRHITKRFPGVLALTDVSFDVRRGEVHALCGENGAGKSTLMKIISGVYTRDSGDMFWKGQPVNFTSPRHAHGRGHHHDLPGTQPDSPAVDHGKYFPRQHVDARRIRRLARHARTGA